MGSRPALGEADKAMTRAEADRLVKAAKQIGESCYRVCRLLLGTGLRASEATALRIGALRLDGESPRLLVTGGKKRKKGTSDQVLLDQVVRDELLEWTRGRKAEDAVLTTEHGKGASRQWVWLRVKAAVKAARLNPLYSPHTLRHRFCTDTAISSDGNVEWVRQQARHSDYKMILRYMHVADSELKAGERTKRFAEVQGGGE